MLKKTLKIILLFSTLITTHNAFAFNGKPLTEECQTPRFDKFSLPVYKAPQRLEVPPEAEFSFTLSSKIAPETVRILMRKETIPHTTQSNTSFHRITAKIPAKYTGKFIRINVFATAKLECTGKDGWLVKVSKPKKDETITPQEKIKESTETTIN
jgi:hypothetical protein